MLSRCPPSLLMMMDSSRALDSSLQSAWERAATSVLSDVEECRLLPAPTAPTPSLPAVTAQTQGNSKEVDMEDFFAMTSALDRLSDELVAQQRSREATGSALAVDQLDTRMTEVVVPSLRPRAQAVIRAYKARCFEEALEHMGELVSLCAATGRLSASVLNNHSVCLYRVEKWEAALAATHRLLDAHPEYDAAKRRALRICIAMGDTKGAKLLFAAHKAERIKGAQPSEAVGPSWQAEADAIKAYAAYEVLYNSNQYSHALRELDALLNVFPCATFETYKVQLLSLESTRDAVRYASKALSAAPYASDLRFWKTELEFRVAANSEELHSVLECFTSAAATPGGENTRFRRAIIQVNASIDLVEGVQSLIDARNWQAVVDRCTNAIQDGKEQNQILVATEGVRQFLFSARATAYVKIQSWYRALDDVQRALSYTEEQETVGNASRLMHLAAQCEEGLHRYRDAVARMRRIISSQPENCATYVAYLRTLEAKLVAQRAREKRCASPPSPHKEKAYGARGSFDTHDHKQYQQHQRESNQPSTEGSLQSFYGTLSLPEDADEMLVKRTYRALAMRWHPDRWCGSSAAEVQASETKFKEIQHAYEQIMNAILASSQ